MRLLVLFAAVTLLAQDRLTQDNEELIARHATLATKAMRTGDYASAETHNRAIVRMRPKLAEAQVNLGLSLFLQKRYEDAIRSFETALKAKPEMANAWLFLGICQFNLNRPGRAIPALDKFIEQTPGDYQGQYYLGLAHLALEQYSGAIKAFVAARAINPRNVDALYHLAQGYLGEARNEPAKLDSFARLYEDTVEQIAAVDPQSFRIAQLRAGYFEIAGEKAKAIQELETLLEHDPKVRGLHYTLGCLYTEARLYNKALRQFDAEMSLDAPYPRTYFQLGHVYLALEKPAQALPLLEKAIQVEPDGAGLIWVDIGRAYRTLNNASRAESAFERAIQLGARDASVYYQLAMAAKSAGDANRSREALEMSQRLRREEKPAPLATQ